MGLARAWARLDVVRRLRSLLVVALVVAVCSGLVLTAATAARRGISVVDRLITLTEPAQVSVTSPGGADWSAIRRLPQVSSIASYTNASVVVDEMPFPESVEPYWLTPLGDDAQRGVERPVVVSGRLADPARADEAVLTPEAARVYRLDIGDQVTLRMFSPAEVRSSVGGGAQLPEVPHGPVQTVQIVGIVSSPYFTDDLGFTGRMIPSAGLPRTYPDSVLSRVDLALVRLRAGDQLSAFRAAAQATSPGVDLEVTQEPLDKIEHARELVAFQAAWLFGLALAALIVSCLVVGQLAAQHAGAAALRLQPLRACGATRRDVALAAAIGPGLAAAAGTLAGCVLAVAASAWTPLGTAAKLEPGPGVAVDLAVLVPALIVVPGCVAALAFAAAHLADSTPSPRPERSPALTRATTLGLPVAVLTGIRFALARRPGGVGAARPALLGVIAGITGLVAALVVAAGVQDALTRPERFGKNNQAAIYLGYAGQDRYDARAVSAVVGADRDVTGILDIQYGSAALAGGRGEGLTVFRYRPMSPPLPMVLTGGHVPREPDEVVLGPSSARRTGATTGDTLRLTGDRGTREFHVTGIGFVPEGTGTNSYTDGVWVTPAGYDSVLGVFAGHGLLIAFDPAADRSAAFERVRSAVVSTIEDGDRMPIFFDPGGSQRTDEVRSVRGLPLALGGFLALVATAALAHALAAMLRRRRYDLAVLRACGMDRRQSRIVIHTHALILVLIGIVAGVPLGLALGRVSWRIVADLLPLQYQMPPVLTILAVVVPGLLVVALTLALVPAARAARIRVAEELRAR